jgi:hypothetical protein
MSAGIQAVVAALLPGGVENSSADDCKDLGNKMLTGSNHVIHWNSDLMIRVFLAAQPEKSMMQFGYIHLDLQSDRGAMSCSVIEAQQVPSSENSTTL